LPRVKFADIWGDFGILSLFVVLNLTAAKDLKKYLAVRILRKIIVFKVNFRGYPPIFCFSGQAFICGH
jgi:hypothetical protein